MGMPGQTGRLFEMILSRLGECLTGDGDISHRRLGMNRQRQTGQQPDGKQDKNKKDLHGGDP